MAKGFYFVAEEGDKRSEIRVVDMPKTNGDTIRAMVGGYMEIAARGKVNGVNCILICHEEGRLVPQPRVNWAAADFATSMTKSPAFLFMGVFGDCVLLADGEEDWRAFTDEEVARLGKFMHHGGFNLVELSA